ncbi:MAG: FG-GAP repeat protein, partial [Phycisphaerales bacterium JB039]
MTRTAVVCVLALGAALPGRADCPPQRLEPPTPWYGGDFGHQVAVGGAHLLVGDRFDDTLCPIIQNCGNGAVHAYRIDAGLGAWRWIQTFYASDIDEYYRFGRSLSLDGDRLIVGASVSDLTSEDAGAAYVFEFQDGRWVETGQIEPVEPIAASGFAHRVAVRGTAAVVGEPGRDLAWVYEETEFGWEMRHKLAGPNEFGNAVAITDDWIFVAAHFDASPAKLSGSVFAYEREPGGGLSAPQKLTPPDFAVGPEFGAAIAAEGNTLMVGGPRSDRTFDSQGAVYHYELVDGEWELADQLTHAEPVSKDKFGEVLSISGDTLVANATGQWTGMRIGVSYVFRRAATGRWTQVLKIDPLAFMESIGAGGAATDGQSVALGAPGETIGPALDCGAAYIFDLDCLLACRPDLDGDGELTFFDFLEFQ